MSDILIKRMEMPRGRGEYELRLYVDSDGTCTVEGSYCSFEGEPFEAVPVPPHGRLIDADALINSMFDNLVEKTMLFGGHYVYTEQEIENAPTIIPAEEAQ